MNTAPELYLTIDIGQEGTAPASAALEAALSAAPFASVLLRAKSGAPLDAGIAKALAGLAQKRGVAVLINDDANLARLIKADGVHLSWSKEPLKAYQEARDSLGEHAMIGADAGRSRDAAMELGEQGADYIAFGIPAHVEDRVTAEARQCDLAAWWSEIFEIPCVAFDIATVEHAAALAVAGTDFITIGVSTAMAAADVHQRVVAFAAATTASEETA